MARREKHFLDGPGARLGAVVVIAACAAALAYIHRADLFPRETAGGKAELNPAFVECRNERTAQVRRMLEEGTISRTQFESFSERAVGFCAARFPPDAPAETRP